MNLPSFLGKKEPIKTIYDRVEPVPQEGRNTTFHYKNDAFIPVDRLTDEYYMNEPEQAMLNNHCKKTQTFGKATVFETTHMSSSVEFRFAIFIPLGDKSFLFFTEDPNQFAKFMRKFWPIMPWIELYLPHDVTQYVPSYRPINKNSSY